MDLARCVAERLGRSPIQEDHILLAIAYEGTDIGAKRLRAMGCTTDAVRKIVDRPGRGEGTRDATPFSAESMNSFEKAAASAAGAKVNSGHLLLAITEDPDGAAALLLKEIGLDLTALRADVREQIAGEG